MRTRQVSWFGEQAFCRGPISFSFGAVATTAPSGEYFGPAQLEARELGCRHVGRERHDGPGRARDGTVAEDSHLPLLGGSQFSAGAAFSSAGETCAAAQRVDVVNQVERLP